jgi:hypothetical protein
MEKIYQIESSIKDSYGVIFNVGIKGGKDEINKVKNSITTKSIWGQDFDIILYFNEDQGSGPVRFLDIHSWQLGRPAAHTLIVSERLKHILEKYTMPSHSFYEISISSEVNRMKYFLLHLHYDSMIELDFSKTFFRQYDLFTKKPIAINNEFLLFNSYDDFKANQKQLVTSSDSFYDSENYIYRNRYNIFWGGAFRILISEEVKKDLLQSDIKGLDIVEFNKYEISFL